ncbi:hypothetical protein, partial [Desulforhabdus sp. TSK]|uniref:hypothetical protein n=1 Tax=Desulforhabdus sp. TSK TaxID=2925014 RepID=UPI001FC7EC25
MDEEIFKHFREVIGSWFFSGCQQFGRDFFRLRAVNIAFLFAGILLSAKISQMKFREEITLSDVMLTGFLVWAIDEAFHEIVVCADAWSVFWMEPGQDGQKWLQPGFFDPCRNPGDFQRGHEKKRSEHRGRNTMISPMHGRVKGIEELHHRVEIEVSKNNELPGMSRHAFPELRVINGCEEIVL